MAIACCASVTALSRSTYRVASSHFRCSGAMVFYNFSFYACKAAYWLMLIDRLCANSMYAIVSLAFTSFYSISDADASRAYSCCFSLYNSSYLTCKDCNCYTSRVRWLSCSVSYWLCSFNVSCASVMERTSAAAAALFFNKKDTRCLSSLLLCYSRCTYIDWAAKAACASANCCSSWFRSN